MILDNLTDNKINHELKVTELNIFNDFDGKQIV